MRNSWSDLFLLGLVQVTNYNKTISIDGYQFHVDRRLSIYLIHSHSAAPNCVFPLFCLHWQVNFLTGWKRTDFLCKGKLVIALPWQSKLGQCLFFPSNQILLTISLGICQIKRHFSLIVILLYRAGQLTKHLSRVRQLAASLEGYSISPQVIFDPSYPLRIKLFSAFLHHPHHFNPPPRPICLPNHHWVWKPLPTGNQPPPPCCFYSSNSLSISFLSTDNSSGVCLPPTLSSLWPRPVLCCPPTSGEFCVSPITKKNPAWISGGTPLWPSAIFVPEPLSGQKSVSQAPTLPCTSQVSSGELALLYSVTW